VRYLKKAILALLIAAPIHAQNTTVPCTTVTANGDTLVGTVYYENWDQNPASIWFSEKGDAYKKYLPADLQSFRVGEDVYLSAEVDVERSSRESESLSFKTKMLLKQQSVFLKVLVLGPKSLFSYKDASGNDFFYIRNDSTFKLLEYKKIYDYSNGKTRVLENKKYVGQLTLYLMDRPDLQETINKVDYTKNSMLALFEKYYKDKRVARLLEKSKLKGKTHFGVFAGPTNNLIQFSGMSFPEFTHGLVPTKITLTPGLFLEITEPRNFGRWSVYGDIQYDTYQFASKIILDANKIHTKLDLDYLKLNAMLRYKIYQGNYSVYIAGGAFFAYPIHEVNIQKTESISSGTIVNTDKALARINPFSNTLFASGILFKNWFVEGRVGAGGGISPYTHLQMDTGNACLLVGYHF
jgi:hypothetical protein